MGGPVPRDLYKRKEKYSCPLSFHREKSHLLLVMLLIPVIPLQTTVGTQAPNIQISTAQSQIGSDRNQPVVFSSGQNLSSYYCGTPEDRVYISLGGGLYSPAVLSVRLGAYIIWKGDTAGPGTVHTITANTTANGSLPSFNATIGPYGEWAYTFTVPGTYYYYDLYNLSNKGEIIVHAAILVGNATLAVDMNPGTAYILENQLNFNGSSFRVNVAAVNAVNLSSWETCLQYDPSIIQETSLTFGPDWDASQNPNALGTGSIYTGDGVILAVSFLLSGTPGINATGPETLFSAS